ncbi:MAG: hypothetical protein EOP84_14440, partial [Verrucomicrobiaceae bacterium]
MPRQNKYDWSLIQAEYDRGQTFRDLRNTFGVQMEALNKARKRGDFITRGPAAASQNQITRYGKRKSGGNHCPLYLNKLSIEQSSANRGGRCSWFEVSGQRVQGTWERDLALKMESLQIVWVKVRKSIRYFLDGKLRRYTPDFYLPEFNLYIELKGFWWGDDRRKMDAVIGQHPSLRLIVVEKE